MTGRDRLVVDELGSVLTRVARDAAPIGWRWLVHRVAVETAARACMPGGLARVARGARGRIERTLGVRAMARSAWLRCVYRDRRMRTVRLDMATHAARRLDCRILAKAVAVATRQ